MNRALRDIPTIQEAQEVAQNIDGALLKKLEQQRFGEKKKRAP